MSFEFGNNLKITIFGQSHSEKIGVCIDGLPCGYEIDLDRLQQFINRRKAGAFGTTSRCESDKINIISGLFNNKTCGSPICVTIDNANFNSNEYCEISQKPRPSHADFTAREKYGFYDYRGGGSFSGRLTAPICVAGGIVCQVLEKFNIYCKAHILSVGNVKDKSFDFAKLDKSLFDEMGDNQFIDGDIKQNIYQIIEKAKTENDSVGGIIQCGIIGAPIGVGQPIFDSVESVISKNIFSIPAVKGIEFGNGFESATLFGSQNNDELYYDGEMVKTYTNNSGGINGGITNGMPIVFNVAFKPTPTIAKRLNTVDLINKRNTTLQVCGRHDSCVVLRAVPVVESMALLSIMDLFLDFQKDGLNKYEK